MRIVMQAKEKASLKTFFLPNVLLLNRPAALLTVLFFRHKGVCLTQRQLYQLALAARRSFRRHKGMTLLEMESADGHLWRVTI